MQETTQQHLRLDRVGGTEGRHGTTPVPRLGGIVSAWTPCFRGAPSTEAPAIRREFRPEGGGCLTCELTDRGATAGERKPPWDWRRLLCAITPTVPPGPTAFSLL